MRKINEGTTLFHMGSVVDEGLEVKNSLGYLSGWRKRAIRHLQKNYPAILWVSDPFDDAYILKKKEGSAIFGVRIIGQEPHSFVFTLKCVVRELGTPLQDLNPDVTAEIQYSSLKDNVTFNLTSIPFNKTEVVLTEVIEKARFSLVNTLNDRYEEFMELAKVVQSLER